MNIWGVMAISGMMTFLIRLSFIALWGKIRMPDILHRALRYVPPAVLAAIIAPELLIQDGHLAFTMMNVRLIAGLAAILVAWKTRNVTLTILAGMVSLYILQYVTR